MTFGFNINEDQDSYKSRAKCMKIIISERQYLMDEDHQVICIGDAGSTDDQTERSAIML